MDLAIEIKVLVEVAVPEVLPAVEDEPGVAGSVKTCQLSPESLPRQCATAKNASAPNHTNSRGKEELGERDAPPIQPTRDVGSPPPHELPARLAPQHGANNAPHLGRVAREIGSVVPQRPERWVLIPDPPQPQHGLYPLLDKDGEEDLSDGDPVLLLGFADAVDAVLLEKAPAAGVGKVEGEGDYPVCGPGGGKEGLAPARVRLSGKRE